MDGCILLLFLVIFIFIIIYCCLNSSDDVLFSDPVLSKLSPIVLGGTAIINKDIPLFNLDDHSGTTPSNNEIRELSTINQNKIIQPLSGDKIVVDGHNIIHAVSRGDKLTLQNFEFLIKKLSKMLIKALPRQDINIIIKNPPRGLLKIYNKLNKKRVTFADELCQGTKKSKKIPYFDGMLRISREFPSITYHLAYDPSVIKRSSPHYAKARDDYLAIYLSNSGYLISGDKFKDYKDFCHIKPFWHYSAKNGDIINAVFIKPKSSDIKKPNKGRHLFFKLMTDQQLVEKNITNGQILLEGSYGIIYISTD